MGERKTKRTYRTKTGEVLTEEDVQALADEAERGYEPDQLRVRYRRGRPPMGSAAADVVPVRLDPELKGAVEARAKADDTTTSEIVRAALREFLHVGLTS